MSDEVDWDYVYRSNYESKAFWYVHWISKARDLYESARMLEPALEAIWDSYRSRAQNTGTTILPDYYNGTYFMLISFAFENLLKAALVSRNSFQYKQQFRLTGKFPSELKGHDLLKLARLLNLTILQQEEDLLRRLTRGATWFGRYPIPLKYTEMSGIEKFSDGSNKHVSWFGRNDVEYLRALIDSLPSRLGLPEDYWTKHTVD